MDTTLSLTQGLLALLIVGAIFVAYEIGKVKGADEERTRARRTARRIEKARKAT